MFLLLAPDGIEFGFQHVAVTVKADFLELECFAVLEAKLQVLTNSFAARSVHGSFEFFYPRFDDTRVVVFLFFSFDFKATGVTASFGKFE